MLYYRLSMLLNYEKKFKQNIVSMFLQNFNEKVQPGVSKQNTFAQLLGLKTLRHKTLKALWKETFSLLLSEPTQVTIGDNHFQQLSCMFGPSYLTYMTS